MQKLFLTANIFQICILKYFDCYDKEVFEKEHVSNLACRVSSQKLPILKYLSLLNVLRNCSIEVGMMFDTLSNIILF